MALLVFQLSCSFCLVSIAAAECKGDKEGKGYHFKCWAGHMWCMRNKLAPPHSLALMAAIHFHFAFERRTTVAKGLPHSWAHVHAYRKAVLKMSQREGEGGEGGQEEGNIVASRAR